MATETLTCQYAAKPHTWKRESTRGRKPTLCPKHYVTVATKAPAKPKAPAVKHNGKETLHCAAGNHAWERESKRGIKPANCPEHSVTKVVVSTTGLQELHCEAGNHTWKRKSKRGVKPRSCPDHSAAKVVLTAPRPIAVNVRPESVIEDFDDEGNKRTLTLEQVAARKAKAEQRIDNLETRLRARGTHLSQQSPFILEKLIKGVAGKRNAKYENAGEYSSLARGQWENNPKNQALLSSGAYRFVEVKSNGVNGSWHESTGR